MGSVYSASLKPINDSLALKANLTDIVPPTTAETLAANAGAGVYAVGSYIWAVNEVRDNLKTPGGTITGSSLRPCSLSGTSSYTSIQNDIPVDLSSYGTGISGTWRCMGYAGGNKASISNYHASLWLRIS